jgi:hypothetical protein
MTSEDGKTFMLHVKRPTGSDLMLGFPHAEISHIVENAAMHASRGKDQTGRTSFSAFKTSSFEIGRGPAGEVVLTLTVGQSGKIRFLLPGDMPGQLSQALQKLAN